MVKSDQKRQQKLARKQAKDRKRRAEVMQNRHLTSSVHGQMLQASTGEIVFCGVASYVKNRGLGSVILVRRCSNGSLAYFCVMLDTYCLGVKDAFGGESSVDKIRLMIEKTCAEPVAPELARGLVDAAIEFARTAGFEPHPDYRNVIPLWGEIEPASIEGHYELGRNGKHLYIQGPFDDVGKQLRIMKTLEAHFGSTATGGDGHVYRRIEVVD